ncbi:hypothetical protein CDV31_004211 [Fusarium ambrosium]|uniref:Uncharacterized protein n=1 Tax=Fusarium ambrosium TaxID=131363 RepID=A0A428URV6_9HYPO|nr:hypothetical protein CDV31_004211 [Fusarium ambrosium]
MAHAWLRCDDLGRHREILFGHENLPTKKQTGRIVHGGRPGLVVTGSVVVLSPAWSALVGGPVDPWTRSELG